MAETSEPIIGVLIKDPNSSGQRAFPVRENSPLSIGRLPDNDIYLADPTIRRRHCQLEVQEGQIYLVIDYPNAWVWVNGTPVTGSCRVNFGDVIGVGKSVLHFERADS